jgi:hypothetical protein
VEERKVTPPIESLPPICVVSKQLYDETTPYFLTRIMPISLNVATSCWLRKWLATFELGYRSIHQLSFRNFHGPEQIKGYELIVLCPNLRYLFVMIGNEHSDPGTVPSLAISSLSSSANAYESLDNIVLMHKLSQLVETPELQVLEFGFHDWEPMSHDRARQVKEWLSVKFRAKGKDVSIVCSRVAVMRLPGLMRYLSGGTSGDPHRDVAIWILRWSQSLEFLVSGNRFLIPGEISKHAISNNNMPCP